MAEFAFPYLEFEWEGVFYCFEVLPFGLSSVSWLFTTVMGHRVKFLHFQGHDLMEYLDDIIFAAGSARGVMDTAQQAISILRELGWLIHPTKCVGTTEAAQIFTALGTLVDLASQLYAVPTANLGSIRGSITALVTGPPRAGVRDVMLLKGLIASTWIATGPATRIRTRALDKVIASLADSASRRARRASWGAEVLLSAA